MASTETKENTKIQEFYSGKTVLVTGGTGFLGKVLTEKLLRSCPDVQRVYLLVREKKGETGREKKLFDDELFLRLKRCQPNFTEKVTVVLGDLHRPRLGLTQSDEVLLTQTVDIVIHSAATVRFDEPLKRAVAVNLVGTKELCLLAERMSNLKAFVYVSTAYCNCDKDWIPERVCPPPVLPEELITLTEVLDDKTLNTITPILLDKKPNTYVYTKCAAEELINSYKNILPVGIHRPSMVLSTQAEPVAGWLESLQGPTGVTMGFLSGTMRMVVMNRKVVMHIVPVDWTANCILAQAYWLATRDRSGSDARDPFVINYVSTASNSVTWFEGLSRLIHEVRQSPSEQLVWYPFFLPASHPWVVEMMSNLLHHWPSRAVDAVAGTQLAKVSQRIDKFFSFTKFFTTTHFHFEERNAALLWDALEPRDQQLFPFNMENIHWQSYLSDYVQGCRHYLLKQNPQTIPQAKRNLKRLQAIHLATLFFMFIFAIVVMFFIFVYNKL